MSTPNPDVAKSDTPPLLLQLQAQIDDDKDSAWAVKNVGGCRPMTWEFGTLSPIERGHGPSIDYYGYPTL
jgi:hypothetical protein